MLAIGPGLFRPTESTKIRPDAQHSTTHTVSGRARHEAHVGLCFFFIFRHTGRHELDTKFFFLFLIYIYILISEYSKKMIIKG